MRDYVVQNNRPRHLSAPPPTSPSGGKTLRGAWRKLDAEIVQFLRMSFVSVARPVGRTPVTAADLFGLLWRSLSDLLGSATTATLLRRSKNAVARRLPSAAEIGIDREGLEYGYTLPPAWSSKARDGMDVMHALVDELRPLLMELTGATILDQLDRVPGFRGSGIVFSR